VAGPLDSAKDTTVAQLCVRNTCWWRSNNALGGLTVNAPHRHEKGRKIRASLCFVSLSFLCVTPYCNWLIADQASAIPIYCRNLTENL